VPELDINYLQLDALRELSSMSAGGAATSIAKMLGKPVTIAVPSVSLEAVADTPDVLGGRELPTTAIYFVVHGDIPGAIFLVLSAPEAARVASALTGETFAEIESLSEMGTSALKEFGNIVVGTYLRTLADVLNVRTTYSVPGFCYDMLGAILDGYLSRMALETDLALVVANEVTMEELIYKAHMVLLMEPKAAVVMLAAAKEWGHV